MTSVRTRLPIPQLAVAAVVFAIVVVAAFVAASLTQDQSIFSLSPPCKSPPCPPPDILTTQRFGLHLAFFTAWAAMILVTPALCTFWFRNSSKLAASYWLSFWSLGLIAFLIHFCWSVFVVFGGDWNKINNTPRVSAPIPDIVITIWWGLDVMLALFIGSERVWVRIQRILVHLGVFVLFFLGSVKEGELCLSRVLGSLMGICVLGSFIVWVIVSLKNRKGGPERVTA